MTTNTENRIPDISNLDRKINYIQFQLNDTITLLDKHYASGSTKIHYIHLLESKKTLEKELQLATNQKRRAAKAK